ncbi:Smr domain-containing protein YPL199C [Hondaea fermentalgiana]|uniref:Smr domain-containing protein YPL199C n=1 Tax=Hondaea fermentalgiana TaxID=2315210 RepID=A0A2R5GCJ9_9STRA|nr:Smr domain-containing protein YPL199C [Hondaea fermentalgiana]|eukprot:GBG28707.1 Smr domain-containing protein YPL199C [Hondaea fermentalgiana]
MTGTTRIVVQVPKNMQGKVIGRGAATLKDIESDYDVKLHMPARDSDSEDVVIEGAADKCEFAKRRVLDIIGQAPDVTSGARAEAQKLYDEADRLFEAARNAGSSEESRDLKDQAHAKRREAEEANERAARVIFEHKNGGYGLDQMDLHGLYVKEAMHFVEERLRKVDDKLRANEMELVIIPGQGIHSSGAAKIKPTVEQYLRDNNYPYELDPAGGQFTVSFKDAGPEVSQPAAAPTPAQPSKPETQAQPANKPDTQPSQPAGHASASENNQSKDEPTWEHLLTKCFQLCFSHFFSSKEQGANTSSSQQQQQQQQGRSAPQTQEVNRSVAQV